MSRVFFLEAIDEVLEIIAIPLSPQAFCNLHPAFGFTLFVFRELVKATFSLTEQMRADIVQVLIIDVNLPRGNLVFHGCVGVFARDRIAAGFIKHIRHALQRNCRKAIWRRLVNRREQWLKGLLLDVTKHDCRDMQRCTVNTLVFPAQPARQGAPHIVNTGNGPGAEEVLFYESNAIFNTLYECSDNPFYSHHFFIRTFRLSGSITQVFY